MPRIARQRSVCLSSIIIMINSKSSNLMILARKTRILKFELDEGFQPYHPAVQNVPRARHDTSSVAWVQTARSCSGTCSSEALRLRRLVARGALLFRPAVSGEMSRASRRRVHRTLSLNPVRNAQTEPAGSDQVRYVCLCIHVFAISCSSPYCSCSITID